MFQAILNLSRQKVVPVDAEKNIRHYDRTWKPNIEKQTLQRLM